MKIRILSRNRLQQHTGLTLLLFGLLLGSLALTYRFAFAQVQSSPTPESDPALASDGGISLNPVADTYINGESIDANAGNNVALRLDADPVVRSYLRFEVPALPGEVTRATLNVYAISNSSTGYEVHTTESGWTENELTFANAPAVGPIIGSSGAFDAGRWTSVDVTSAVTESGEYNFVLTSVNITATRLASREDQNMPVLIVETTNDMAVAQVPTETATPLPQPTATATLLPQPTKTPVPPASPTIIPTPLPTVTPPPLVVPSATPSAEIWYINNTPSTIVNGRTCPRLSCRVVAQFSYGDEIRVIGVVEGEEYRRNSVWVQVARPNTSEIYVHSSLVSRNAP